MKDIHTYTRSGVTDVTVHWLNKHKYHFLIWALFIANEIATARIIAGNFAPFLNYLVHYLINIGFSYSIALYLLPRALKLKRYLIIKFILALILAILIYLIAVLIADQLLSYFTNYQFGTAKLNLKHYFAVATIWRAVSFMIPGVAYYLFTAYHKSRERILEQEIRKKEAEIALAESKNAYLKAQINPHFLFNAFNMLYIKSRKKDTPLADAILYISKIMRYAVSVNQSDRPVTIGEELEHVNHLIHFWEIQNQQKCKILINCTDDALEVEFIPLILLTLVENMLKHADWESPVHVPILSIRITEDQLQICTCNSIHDSSRTEGFHSGLLNVGQRLSHSYGDLASLMYGTDSEGTAFNVKIKINRFPIEVYKNPI